MADLPVFLDVNIPMYAAGRAHRYKAPCVRIMTDISHGHLPAAMDTEIVQEILYRFGALQEWSTAVEMANSLLALVSPVFPVTVADMETAIQLAGRYGPQGVHARDVVHAAVMHNHNLTTIISTDGHFDLFPGLTRLDPMNY